MNFFEHKIILKEKDYKAMAAAKARISDKKDGPNPLSAISQQDNSAVIPQEANDEEISDETIYEKKMVTFLSTPEIQEQGTVLYISIDDIRSAGSHSVYLGSPARIFNISHKFISRSRIEAEKTFRAVNLLRAWRMPKTGSALDYNLSNFESVGGDTNAPSVLNLFGYGRTFRGIPVVITSLSIDWNSDSDYIKCNNGSDVPIILPVTISLKEMRTVKDMNTFRYEEFKEGRLKWW